MPSRQGAWSVSSDEYRITRTCDGHPTVVVNGATTDSRTETTREQNVDRHPRSTRLVGRPLGCDDGSAIARRHDVVLASTLCWGRLGQPSAVGRTSGLSGTQHVPERDDVVVVRAVNDREWRRYLQAERQVQVRDRHGLRRRRVRRPARIDDADPKDSHRAGLDDGRSADHVRCRHGLKRHDRRSTSTRRSRGASRQEASRPPTRHAIDGDADSVVAWPRCT